MTAPTKKTDAYQVVTDRICEALEAGFVPWHKPWRAGDGPRSLSTGKPYRGINVWVLAATGHARGYTSNWWGTYRQIQERGGQVRKGETGSPVVFWRIIEKKDPVSAKVTERIPLLRYFTVFNADQCDDLKVPEPDEPLPDVEPIAGCDELLLGYLNRGGPSFERGSDSAYYSPPLDQVRVPLIEQFESAEAYYGVVFHECVHSTGHLSRLNRKSLVDSNRFGDEDYSREELVAEMGAAFVCGTAGIDVNVPQHAGYIQSWLKAFRGDPKILVQAAGAAQKAADLIVGTESIEQKEEGI